MNIMKPRVTGQGYIFTCSYGFDNVPFNVLQTPLKGALSKS